MLNPINVIVLADYIVAKSRAIVPRNRTRKFLRDTVQLNNTRQGISSTLRDKRSLDSVHYHPIPNRFARVTILSEKIVMVRPSSTSSRFRIFIAIFIVVVSRGYPRHAKRSFGKRLRKFPRRKKPIRIEREKPGYLFESLQEVERERDKARSSISWLANF